MKPLPLTPILVVLVALILSACGGSQSRLDVLLEDPMANPTLSFAEPSRHREYEGDASTIVNSSSPAEVSTAFDLTLEQFGLAEQELLDQAEQAGYFLEEEGFSERDQGLVHYQGFRTTPDGSRIMLRLLFGTGEVQVRLM